jgi:hypothetical protein
MNATDVFGDDLGGSAYDASLFRIGTYDPETGAYLEYPDFQVIPGQAYWVLAREGMDLDISGIPITTDYPVDVRLRYSTATGNGWNMIGPPNNREYPWDEVEVVVYGADCQIVFGPTPVSELKLEPTNPYIDTRLWEWAGGGYNADAAALEPHCGYWVRALAPGVVLRFVPSLVDVGKSVPEKILEKTVQVARQWGTKLFSLKEAVAGEIVDEDTPPMPMGTLQVALEDDRSSFVMGCFIGALEK